MTPPQGDRRQDDRIDDIKDMVKDIKEMFYGDGLEPGLKDVILHTNRTLHGTKDEKGLVERVSTLESSNGAYERDRARVIGGAKVVTAVGALGAGAWNFRDAIGKLWKAFIGG